MTTDPALLLADRARAISGTLDQQQWALAELAADAKADGVPAWAQIVARVQGRSPKRVREWAAVWEFRAALPNAPEALWAYYEQAHKRKVKADKTPHKLTDEQIVELLEIALAENVSADEYSISLQELLPAPEPDLPRQWGRWSVTLLGQVDSYADPVRTLLRDAALALSEAATSAKGQKA